MSESADRCHAAALRILSYRFNSESELRRKLAQKRFEPDDIAGAIERLRREGWIDDSRFASALVRTRMAKQIGRNRIVRELRAAGVDDDTAAGAVAENSDEEGEAVRLAAAAARRARILGKRHGQEWVATAEGRNKLAVWLLKQGYDAALVRSAVKEVLRGDPSEFDDQPDP